MECIWTALLFHFLNFPRRLDSCLGLWLDTPMNATATLTAAKAEALAKIATEKAKQEEAAAEYGRLARSC